MATYPIKMLKDELNKPFIPFVPELALPIQHNSTQGRDVSDSHPISAISGLSDNLHLINTRLNGAAVSYTFDTVADMDNRIANDPVWLESLQIGNNFYILDPESPDYWWDGTQARVLEEAKVDLTDYYQKQEVDNKDAQVLLDAKAYVDSFVDENSMARIIALENKTQHMNSTAASTQLSGGLDIKTSSTSGSEIYTFASFTDINNNMVGTIGTFNGTAPLIYGSSAPMGFLWRPSGINSTTGQMVLTPAGNVQVRGKLDALGLLYSNGSKVLTESDITLTDISNWNKKIESTDNSVNNIITKTQAELDSMIASETLVVGTSIYVPDDEAYADFDEIAEELEDIRADMEETSVLLNAVSQTVNNFPKTLVAETVLAADSATMEVTGLDIVRDGGIYDIEIAEYSKTTSTGGHYVRLNSQDSGYVGKMWYFGRSGSYVAPVYGDIASSALFFCNGWESGTQLFYTLGTLQYFNSGWISFMGEMYTAPFDGAANSGLWVSQKGSLTGKALATISSIQIVPYNGDLIGKGSYIRVYRRGGL